jgi:hypothetical protein
MEEVRFSWRAYEDAPRTMVDLKLEKVDDATTKVQIVHAHAGVDIDQDKMTAHWKGALDALAA